MDSNETILDVKNLSYKPAGVNDDLLHDISFSLQRGDLLLLLGPSGCGKSILTRCLDGLIPQIEGGDMRGSVIVAGKDTKMIPVYDLSSNIGLIFQNPDDQILSLKVVDEVSWGVETQGQPHQIIVERVNKFMELLGITQLKERLTFAISGGEKQKVSIASNLSLLQDILVLDDPTTDLDPVCKAEVVQVMDLLHRDMGKTLIVIEHDLDTLISLANRMVIMDHGGIIFDDSPIKILTEHYKDLLNLGVNIPQHLEIVQAILNYEPLEGKYPIKKEEAFTFFKKFIESHPAQEAKSDSTCLESNKGVPIITVQNLVVSYNPEKPVLKNLSFQVFEGEFVAIVGANGSGKSTLVSTLIGLLHPDSGDLVIDGCNTKDTLISDLAMRIGYVFQNPDHQLFTNNVADEVGYSLKMHGVVGDEAIQRSKEVLDVVELGEYLDRHPFSLSRGQRQKLAVATALVHKPKIILLDEPTTGQDGKSLAGLLQMMTRLRDQGHTIIMVTHNMDIVANFATRVIVMNQGQIVADGRPEDVFYDQYDDLEALRLRPPTVIEFCRQLEDKGMPRFLTIDELLGRINFLGKEAIKKQGTEKLQHLEV
jgi:energy-coupling factor transporter ATP-binding protein EcfA2